MQQAAIIGSRRQSQGSISGFSANFSDMILQNHRKSQTSEEDAKNNDYSAEHLLEQRDQIPNTATP